MEQLCGLSRRCSGRNPRRLEHFRKLVNNLKKIEKCIILVYFQKILKPELKFLRLDEKHQCLRKVLEFLMKIQLNVYLYYFWKIFIVKMDPLSIASDFYNNFPRFVGIFPLYTPGYATSTDWVFQINLGMELVLHFQVLSRVLYLKYCIY